MKKRTSIIQTTLCLIFIIASTFGLVLGVKPSFGSVKLIKIETTTNSFSKATILKLKFLDQKYSNHKTVNNLLNLINFGIKSKITNNLKLKNFNLNSRKFLEEINNPGWDYERFDTLYKTYDKHQNWGNLYPLLASWNYHNPSDETFYRPQRIQSKIRELFKRRTDLNWRMWFHDKTLLIPKKNLSINALIWLLEKPMATKGCITGINREYSENNLLIRFLTHHLKDDLAKINWKNSLRLKISRKKVKYINKPTIANLKRILRLNQRLIKSDTTLTRWLIGFFRNDLKIFNNVIKKIINK